MFLFIIFISFYAHPSVQPDRAEVIRLPCGGGDQRYSSSYGLDSTWGQSAKGSQLESSKGDDGQSGHVLGLSDELQ